jgi:hypothetical protein
MIPKFLYAILLMSVSTEVFACDCIPDDSIVNAYKNANIVFEGRVVKIDTVLVSDTANIISPANSKPHIEVTVRKFLAVKFSMAKLFKGDNQNSFVTVMTSAVETRCGFQFILNNNYLVYGYTAMFSLIVHKGVAINNNKTVQSGNLNISRYSTSSCTRTTSAVKYELSELKKNELIK